ncbi:acetyltransferase [Paramaledivibacter caminithermalis]|jgi:UDP-perosamine 4-acetyltransferase|uniref:UDP-perosamine 4-acetyltransferase n=1 Tax=Paramaledivibacter caminithermalis (strain DSM 15212 / CIP 107654 / DViRD3) TaxID=1121301 RepID=A0A1M6JTZ2_PARC5|nr:acetyltransferase [Paramaledivibacter caminithermalis]SHJ50129.1 UDP-perosamine 4-acetyltransferase [Paramaledivibacter caminithermalis DSM 15212]
MKKKIILIGAGGHAKVIIDILNKDKDYEIIGCLDKNYKYKPKILGYDVMGDDSIISRLYNSGIRYAFVALGDNRLRYKISENLIAEGFSLINVISKNAYISDFVKLGYGIAIMPGVVINANTIVGNNTIINTNASIDHDCSIGDNCHVAPGSSLSGYVNVENGAFLGTGCNVRDGVKIGKWSIIGVGSAVVKDIPSYSLAYGVPAKIIRGIRGI